MQARDLAIDDANANAQQIAQKLGVKVGNIKSFRFGIILLIMALCTEWAAAVMVLEPLKAGVLKLW